MLIIITPSAIWVHDSIIVIEVYFLTDHDDAMIFVLVIMINCGDLSLCPAVFDMQATCSKTMSTCR